MKIKNDYFKNIWRAMLFYGAVQWSLSHGHTRNTGWNGEIKIVPFSGFADNFHTGIPGSVLDMVYVDIGPGGWMVCLRDLNLVSGDKIYGGVGPDGILYVSARVVLRTGKVVYF